MPNAFTHYWIERVNREIEGEPLQHVASNDFRERGVAPGDSIFCVNQHDGKLFLIARMRVDKITDANGATEFLGSQVGYAERTDHCVCSLAHGTPILFDRELPINVAQQLRFETSAGNTTAIKFNANGDAEQQTLRKVRRLTADSAALLDQLIEGQELVELAQIETLDELAENFNTFQREARNHRDRATDLLRKTTYWVRDTNSGAFGPGKFLGFKRMDFLTYDLSNRGRSTGAPFQGSITRQAIEAVVGNDFEPGRGNEREPDPRMITWCREWGERLLGAGAFGNANPDKWRFLSVALPGRESTAGFPDEISQPERYFEGVLKTVTVNVYERNPAARRTCIAHYGPSCRVCALLFNERYGDIGDGFIHVHHLKPMGQIRSGYEVDPINDLRPVCPNCHAMLHTQEPPLTIDELKRRLRR